MVYVFSGSAVDDPAAVARQDGRRVFVFDHPHDGSGRDVAPETVRGWGVDGNHIDVAQDLPRAGDIVLCFDMDPTGEPTERHVDPMVLVQ
ncbi:MAG: hypothetical protein LBB18_00980 [Puniceicoccales bacterium]|jgi:hypothetical protein|nr:hypothetical protein [Puniceicoccales bacterium]